MQEKTTSALERELSGCASLQTYLKANTRTLHAPELPELLQRALQKSGLSRAEVLRRSNLNTIYGYQIFSGKRRPSRDSLLCLCFGLGLGADETQSLLLHAGYAQLYIKNPRDSILFYALNNHQNLVSCNQQLDAHGEALLG